MPEGDTIHRAARKIHVALAGKPMQRAEAPSPRSPIHNRGSELAGLTLERAEARGKHLILVSASRARNDPALLQLGPDPLRPEYDREEATARLLAYEPSAAVGEALNDQSLIAGIGNVIRIEACFLPKISPWRKIGDLNEEEARAIVDAASWVMETSMARGSRPKQIYGRSRRPCPRCGGRILTHGQGDDNRVTFWCESCQR